MRELQLSCWVVKQPNEKDLCYNPRSLPVKDFRRDADSTKASAIFCSALALCEKGQHNAPVKIVLNV